MAIKYRLVLPYIDGCFLEGNEKVFSQNLLADIQCNRYPVTPTHLQNTYCITCHSLYAVSCIIACKNATKDSLSVSKHWLMEISHAGKLANMQWLIICMLVCN